jgi:hypothetical protein
MAAAQSTGLPKQTVDLNKLKEELLAAKHSEDRYKRENDAKFRAIAQRVESYEEFRDIVKASHLKPVDPKEITTLSSSRQPWNTLGGKDGEEPETLSNFVEKDCVPNNLQEFLRVWRKLDREDVEGRYRLLMSLGVEGMKRIFPVEVSSEVVGDIITALHHGCCDAELVEVVQILEWMAQSKRVSLSISFLSRPEKHCLQEIFNRLEQKGVQVDFKDKFIQ